MMARRAALRGGGIAQLLNEGHWKRGKWVSVCYRESREGRWGVLAGRRFGNAVQRNRIRRRMREIGRGLGLGSTEWEIALFPLKRAGQATHEELSLDMADLLHRSGVL